MIAVFVRLFAIAARLILCDFSCVSSSSVIKSTCLYSFRSIERMAKQRIAAKRKSRREIEVGVRKYLTLKNNTTINPANEINFYDTAAVLSPPCPPYSN